MCMEKQIVLKALRTPYLCLLEIALEFASLSKVEKQCIYGVIVEGDTEEAFAEKIERSRDFVTRHKSSGIKRLQYAWAYMDDRLILDMCNYN